MAWIFPSTTATPIWSRWPPKGWVPAEQVDLAVEHDRGDRPARPRQSGNRSPLVGGGVVDEALGMRAAVLLDEAAEGVDFRPDRDARHVIARQREGRLQRPGAGFRIEHLVEDR